MRWKITLYIFIPDPFLVSLDENDATAFEDQPEEHSIHHGLVANLNGTQIDLSWIVSENATVDYFEIEKSINGFDFYKMLNINSLDDVQGELYYKAKDKNPAIGTNYYRLVNHLADGTEIRSEIQTVDYQPSISSLNLYPNPTNGTLFIETNLLKEQGATIQILNNLSQQLMEFKFEKIEPTIQLDLTSLPNGVYYLVFQTDNHAKVEQILIQR